MITEFYQLLSSHPIEVRKRTTEGKWESQFVENEDDFADACEQNGHIGVYASLQQLKPDAIKYYSNGTPKAVSKDDVEKYTAICFDCDPVRDGAATPEQQQAALETAKKIGGLLNSKGWGDPTYMQSGNGAYCIFKINLPKQDKPLIHGCLLAADRLFSNEKVKVDTTLASEGQVIRVPGTINLKVPDQPREARLLTFHQTIPQPVPRELVIDFADPIPEKRYVKGDEISAKQFSGQVADVAIYFKKRGYHVVSTNCKNDCTILQLSDCPCNRFATPHDHTKQPYVYVYKNGNLGFKCFADKHAHITFRDIEQQFNEQFDCYRAFDNPQRLAEEYLEDNKLIVVEDETYRYLDRWVVESSSTSKMKIRPFIQGKFDERARHANEPSKPLAEDKVKNTLASVQSLCHFDKPPEKIAPFFVVDHEWDDLDVLPVANGLVNIRKYVEGESCFIERTPDYFCTDHSEVIYDPKAQCPTWHKYLDNLGRSPEFVQTLNEIIAYSIWRALYFQRFINLFGQTAGGKGIFVGVLKDICHQSFASIYMKGLTSESFPLEEAPNKRLLLFPESKIPAEREREVVDLLKAITGGDAIQVNRKNQSHISVPLAGTVISQTNNVLKFDDPSGAFNRRLICLPFASTFENNKKKIKDLNQVLKAEYSGILNVALEAAKTLYARGDFMLPPESSPFLESSEDDSNPIKAFQDDYLVYKPGSAVQTNVVCDLYQKWHSKNGQPAMHSRDLIMAIREAMTGQVTTARMTSTSLDKEHHGRKIQQHPLNQSGRKNLFLDLLIKKER